MFWSMKEAEKIIQSAPVEMQDILETVYSFNSRFDCDKKLLTKILSAMIIIDRKFFVNAGEPYADSPLPIGREQTISQPLVVARMLLLAELKEEEEVLEVGAGSGWNASLAGYLVYPGSVLSVDRIESLVEKAKGNLVSLKNYLKQGNSETIRRLKKINFLAEDAFSGKRVWKKKYDKIIITAGITNKEIENKVEKMAKNLLKQDGLLICPYQSGPMLIYRKTRNRLEKDKTREGYTFVKLLRGEEK